MKYSSSALVASYFTALACFLVLDTCWLTWMGPGLYRPALSSLMASQVNWIAAVLFYLLYISGLLVFAIAPACRAGRASVAAKYGAFFGLVAYATYDLTNQATLRDWPWTITLADLAWGAFASSVAAAAATRLACRQGTRRLLR